MIQIKKRRKSIFMLIIGVIFIVYGIYRGEIDTVFTKAIRVCMECIGIG
ncbi:MAG: hypothetical protein HUJ88_07265 [Fusobacterium necrophorum]|nr:hypothetical protein [Fusobacterium necrophorum]